MTSTLSADRPIGRSADRRLAAPPIAGEFDLGTAELFHPDLERLLNARAGDAVYVEDPLDGAVPDATSPEFLDSSGLRVLLRGAQVAEGLGTAFRLVAPHPAVRRVLGLRRCVPRPGRAPEPA